MKELLKAIKALSDETRLRIMNLLLERECCVYELMQALAISETRASRNLRLLYDAGFLKLRKEGLWSLYSIDYDEAPAYFAELVKAVKKALTASQEASQDRERLKMAEHIGSACVCCWDLLPSAVDTINLKDKPQHRISKAGPNKCKI